MKLGDSSHLAKWNFHQVNDRLIAYDDGSALKLGSTYSSIVIFLGGFLCGFCFVLEVKLGDSSHLIKRNFH